MPSEVSLPGAAHDREPTVEELGRELAEAREQQAATAEILAAISSSPTDPHSVFAKIAASAARLCAADDAVIRQVDGEVLRLVAHDGPIPNTDTLPLTRAIPGGRAVLDRQTKHLTDMQVESGDYPGGSDIARRLGVHTILAVPLIRGGEAIGVNVIRRTEVHPFTDRQIDLLKSTLSAILRSKRSSPSRTRASSTSCAKLCSSRPPPPKSSRSSVARLQMFSPCS